jgi:hypothetical protein
VSATTYKAAVRRLRDQLDVFGPPQHACLSCGHPDSRHELALQVTLALEDGIDADTVAARFLPPGLGETPYDREVVFRVAFAVLAADPRRHSVGRNAARGLERAAWGEP